MLKKIARQKQDNAEVEYYIDDNGDLQQKIIKVYESKNSKNKTM